MELTISGDQDNKLFIVLQALKEEAHKQLSYYRQKQDDLVARMATEWPAWGCTLDFYTDIILPLLKNSFILHFINRSEGFGLGNTDIKLGYYKQGHVKTVTEEFDLTPKRDTGPEEPKKEGDLTQEADLVDFALYLLTSVLNIRAWSGREAYPLSGTFSNWKLDIKNRMPLSIRVRDADIGAQAFLALLEGIMRNASKHGMDLSPVPVRSPSGKFAYTGDKTFRVKIVFCDQWSDVNDLVHMENPGDEDSKRYSFILITVSRDLIYNPDGSGERKIDQQTLVEFLTERFGEVIVDNKGKVTTGNWGIKEMKTCAAFLAGQPIDAVNQRIPRYVRVGKTKNDKIWSSGERLCYIVRVEKPKHVLAILPDYKKPQNHDEWGGIRFVSDTKALFSESVDYDFLYIDDEAEQHAKDAIQRNKHILPSRVVTGDLMSEVEADDEAGSAARKFALTLYSQILADYLDKLDKNQEVRLRIYFEDDTRADKWRGNDGARTISIPPTIELKGGKKIHLDFLKRRDDLFDREFEGYQLGIFRHMNLDSANVGRGESRGSRADISYSPYYAQKVSGADPFFNLVLSVDPEANTDLTRSILCQIAESALLNILIVDERIAQALQGLKAKDDHLILLLEKLYWMGIHIAGSIRAGDKVVWTAGYENERLLDISIDSDGSTTNTVGGLPINIVLIHATRLNEIFDELRRGGATLTKDDFILGIERSVDRLIVHSGRGKTEGDIPKSVPFLEYSTVEKHVLSEPSKFYLVQIALSVKGDRE